MSWLPAGDKEEFHAGTHPRDSFPRTEFADRCVRAAAAARARGFDALLAWSRGGTLDAFFDVHYLTGHMSPMVWVPPLPGILAGCEHSGVVISADGETTLLATHFVAEGAVANDIRRSPDLARELVAALRDRGLGEGRIGLLGGEVLPFAFGEELRRALPRLVLEPADDLSAELRRWLSEADLDALRRASRAGVHIYDAFTSALVAGTSEGEAVATALAEAARIPGCAHWNFLASGPDPSVLHRSAFPSWQPEYRYRSGDVVHADCFGFVDGFAYDLARTVTIGDGEPPGQSRVSSGTRAACEAMAAALRPGTTPRELYATGSAALADGGLEPVAPGFGHGIGAGFFRPYIFPAGPDLDLPLAPRLGISFEVFATDGLGNYAYHEDAYAFLEDGVELLTR
jgi:Xaa-Pro dipeptidase